MSTSPHTRWLTISNNGIMNITALQFQQQKHTTIFELTLLLRRLRLLNGGSGVRVNFGCIVVALTTWLR